MRKPVIIFSNQKGGVGKTTTCRELSLYTATLGKQVCIIDADPQGNLTKSLVSEDDIISGLYEALNHQSYKLMEVNANLWLLAGVALVNRSGTTFPNPVWCRSRNGTINRFHSSDASISIP